MADDVKLKMTLSQESFSSHALREKRIKANTESSPSTSYEVFRNNTTAVEVVVKEVTRNKKKMRTPDYHDTDLTKRLEEDVVRLRRDLDKANSTLERARKGFLSCLREIKKQADTANLREMDTRAKNLTLQLENEKLKTILTSKTNLVSRLRKELNNLRRIIKFVVKNKISVPQVETISMTCNSDPEYDDFENDLKQDLKVKLETLDEMSTFDSTISKEAKNNDK